MPAARMDQRTIERLLEDWRAGREAPRALRTSFALVLSGLVWPGLGQLYNRDFKKGLAFILVAAVSAVTFFVAAGARVLAVLQDPGSLDLDRLLAISEGLRADVGGVVGLAGAVMIGTWLVAIVDAYLVARSRPERASSSPSAATPGRSGR
jgi:hypothetical protein